MAGKNFRLFASALMLILYTSVLAVSGAVALTCDCEHHHDADVHTAFAHIHSCHHSHNSCEGDCNHHHCFACESGSEQIISHHCCNHNHSNSIELYTQPRSTDSDTSERESILLAVVTDVLDFIEAEQQPAFTSEYGEYLLSSLSAGYCSGGALRAPPQLV